MKILLIYPYFLEPRIHVEESAAVPMGLYYIGALLKAQGYQVEILNWHMVENAEETVKETLIAKEPDIIGFSIVHANRWGGIDIARVAKALFPQVPVVFGGIGATFLWRHLLNHFNQIDYIVLGEGEYTFSSLVSALEDGGDPETITEIRGLALRTDKGLLRTDSAAPIRDLDDLPPPARYFDFQHLSMTRGCPGRCNFCGSPQFWGRRVRSHSTEYMVDQLAMMAERGRTHFFMSDDTFTVNRHRVIDFCQKIIDRGLTLSWQAISKVSAVDDEMLYWMRKAGCMQISYGVESGSPEIRQRLCKDIEHGQIVGAFRRTVAHGILSRAYFIYGAPGETWRTIDQTLDLIRKIKPLSVIFYIMDLFPGTELYEDYKERSGVDDDMWLQRIEDKLYFETDDALDQHQVLAFGRRLRESYDQWLPEFAQQIVLDDIDSLAAEQADFLSRLGLTFSHGDYARLKGAVSPISVARRLYQQALDRHPDHRAFWGLALIHQQAGDRASSIEILQQGLRHYPQSAHLNICLGIEYCNQGRYRQALPHLEPFDNMPDAVANIIRCLHALGRSREAQKYARMKF